MDCGHVMVAVVFLSEGDQSCIAQMQIKTLIASIRKNIKYKCISKFVKESV